MVNDYRAFSGGTTRVLKHSAKGSQWEKHKYVKVLEGVYFYPDSYKGGRHISSLEKAVRAGTGIAAQAIKDAKAKGDDKDDKVKIGKKRLDKLANAVISGKYGNGQDRMKKLGKKYDKVQHRVNQILLGEAGAKKVLQRKKKASATAKKSTTSKKSSSKKTTSKK